MAISSQGTTFTFPGITAVFTSISVEDPVAEIVDMTPIDAPLGTKRMVATGEYTTPGRVRIDYLRLAGTPAPLTMSGLSGTLSIAHSAVSVSKTAILESASSEIAVGQALRGSMSFVLTDA
jgi:hypothetical protein